MEKQAVKTNVIRAMHRDIATGMAPDMRKEGYDSDEWPAIYQDEVMRADLLVLAGPIWLGDNSSVMKRVIERLYSSSSDMNEKGQPSYYGRVGGVLITGNEDGVKHCSMNVLYSLQHIGYSIPPQADAGWLGEIGPGQSYGDDGAGFDNDFTNSHVTSMTWNMLHLARLLKDTGGYPPIGNVPSKWSDGERWGFENPVN